MGEFNSVLLVDLLYRSKRHSMRNRSLETSCWPITRYGSSHVDEMFTPWYCSTNGSCSKKSNEIICKHRKLRLQEHEKVFRESGPSIFLCNKLWRRYIALLLWFYQSVHMTSLFDLVQVQDRDYTVMSIFVKLDRYVDYAEKLNCFDFKGQGHNEEIWYFNMILGCIKPDILPMIRARAKLLFFKVRHQRSR